MHVEVNEFNIALYDLVRFTGNSKEELLRSAREAEGSGYTLYCKIPDPDGPIEINAFEHFESNPAPKITIVRDQVETDSCPSYETDFNIIDVVEGEVVEE